MKKYFILAAAALSFAACSSDDEVITKQEAGAEQGQVPVLFDSYVNRGTTRAGDYLSIPDAATLKTTEGFGVFGYYTDNNDYDQFAIPNFMYNQRVSHSGSTWTYAPIKYWPNEYGSTAISDDYDKVTFFAYAPYVDVIASTGKIDESGANTANKSDATGIVGMSSNTGSGDPFVKYVVSLDPAKCVDLLWGVNDGTPWALQQTGAAQTTLTAGLPWLNVQRPDDAETKKMTFMFKHALSQLNVTVDAKVDGTTVSNAVADDNKIFIRSITFTGFALKGALNLNNTDAGATLAKWMTFNGLTDLELGDEVTIYDGQKDGREGVSQAANEKTLGLNSRFIENGKWSEVNVASKGVIAEPENLFASAVDNDPILVIPTGDKVNVTIVYEVEAADDNLPTFLADGVQHGSRIKNTITKNDVFTGGLVNGKSYTLNLHLGMNSVKFDVDVTDWSSVAAKDVDLPEN